MQADAVSPVLHYAMLRERLFGQPLLAEPWAVAAVVSALSDRLGIGSIELPDALGVHAYAPGELAAAAMLARDGGTRQDQIREGREYRVQNGVAVIPAAGKLVTRSAQLRPVSGGLTGYNAIGDALDMAMADQDVRGIALDVDSPGGEAPGAFDLWQRVANARGQGKPIWAIVFNQAGSSAYGLASAADRVVAPEFGEVGSIGVVGLHADLSGALAQKGIKVTVLQVGDRKTDGNPFQSLAPDVAERWQGRLDGLYQRFVAMVAAHRGTTQKAVRATEGELMFAREAKDVGLVDALAPPHEALAEFTEFVNRGSGSAGRPAKGAGMTAQHTGAAGPAASDTYTREDVDRARADGLEQGRRETAQAQESAVAQARADATAAERARVGAILGSEQTEGRGRLARSLATDTDLSAEQATKVLASAPQEPGPEPQKVEVVRQATDFEQHMAGLRNPQVGADAGEEDELSAIRGRFRQRAGRI